MKTFEQFIQDEPTIEYYPNGNISRKIWRNKQREIHRETGPAIINYSKSGNVFKSYYLNGNYYKMENWLEKLKTINPEQYEIQKKKKEFVDLGI